jgi:cellulose synthase operon protein C
MPKLLPRNTTLRLLIIVGALAVFLGVGAVGARYVAWPMFKTWREKRANEVARDLYEKADYPGAILAVRKTLGYNQMNVEAWRLAVQITEKQGVPDVIFYQEHLANVQPTFENRLKHIRLAAKFHAYAQAEKTIAKIGAEGGKSAEFLELAAQVSRRTGNPTKAKYYLMSLVSLQPNNNKARFELAHLRLLEGVKENKPSIRAEIRNLASDPELRPRALGLLLADSLQSQDSAEALELADQLANVNDEIAPNQVLVADAYRRYAPSRFTTYLEQLQRAFAEKPEKVIVLTNYMIGNEMAAETRAWIDSLSDKVKENEGVQVTYAYALLLQKDFPALEKYLRGCKWTENEFARHALLAYRHRAAGQTSEFNEEWKLAVIELGNNPRRLQTLTAQVTSWGWQEQRFELLWKRFMLEPGNQPLRNELIGWERSRGNTGALNRLFSRIVETDPGDMDSKNNYAYTSMLLGVNLERAYQSANQAYRSNPKNPFFATTYALALYRQGKAAEALEIMQGLGVLGITVPERTLLNAILLVANGHTDEGASLMAPLKADTFLPEERRMMVDAVAAIDRSRQEQGSAARLAALTSAASSGTDRKSWLRVIPPSLAEKPTVDMEIAESLYANDDYKGLENSLKDARWDDREFLRQALIAYAQFQQQRLGEASNTWRIAVAAGSSRSDSLSALAELAHRWAWNQEYIEILNRLFQRDRNDNRAFTELVEHYTKTNQTGELARIYELRLDGTPNDADAKGRFAYYSLLTNTNNSRAYILAREAYEAAPDNSFRAKVYAFSLYKQSRGTDANELLQKLPGDKESGQLQLSLVKAALAVQQNRLKEARSQLQTFDASSALPEEAALAENIAKTLQTRDS